jgi:4-hydroxythreonine-4-phosphate dehydrogenase
MSPILITPGDPLGIGPEVTAKALAKQGRNLREYCVVGDSAAFIAAAASQGLPLSELIVVQPPKGEPVEVAAIRQAVEMIRRGEGSALVTGPINKAKLARQGFPHSGHTDFLGEICGVENPVMAFVGDTHVRVVLVTVHIPLSAVPSAVTQKLIQHTVVTASHALQRDLGIKNPQLLVCGLNPHAGDDGLLGHEDKAVIQPAVKALCSQGLNVSGPVSAEAAFLAATRGQTDMVVAMYHDQGLAPLKALTFGRSVNWTLGLPIIRVSVDHGTAYDLVGRDMADAGSMCAALTLASQLVAKA